LSELDKKIKLKLMYF